MYYIQTHVYQIDQSSNYMIDMLGKTKASLPGIISYSGLFNKYFIWRSNDKQEASRPDSSTIDNWLSNHRKFTQSEIRSSQSRFEHAQNHSSRL